MTPSSSVLFLLKMQIEESLSLKVKLICDVESLLCKNRPQILYAGQGEGLANSAAS